MTFCGHNDTMANGLAAFGKGLAIQTDKRAADENVPLAEIPAIELAELRWLNEALANSPKRAALGGIASLGLFVTFLYEELARRLRKNPSLSAEAAFAGIMEEQNRLLFAMEDHYYKHLRPNLPRADAIQGICTFLEEQVS